jgi:hypothetical protein
MNVSPSLQSARPNFLRLRLFRDVLIVPAFLVAATIALAAPRAALGSCNPGRAPSPTQGFAGALVGPGSYPTYIRSSIQEYDPYVSPGSVVSAWALMTIQSVPGKYAQTGWVRWSGRTRITFVEYITDSLTTFYREYTTQPSGNYTKYEVRALIGSPAFQFLAAGSVLANSTGVTWHPNYAQFEGETHNYNDQMPGGTSVHEEFSNVQYSHDLRTWTYVGSPATIFPGTFSTIYGATKVTDGDYRIWDKGCSS